MFQLLYKMFQSWRFSQAAKAPVSSSRCIACDSKSVTMLAEMVYRCDMCGYEGGQGYARWKQESHLRALLSLSEEEQRAKAKKNLLEAKPILLSGLGDLAAANSHGTMDVLGFGGGGIDGQGLEKHQMMLKAVQMLLEGEKLVRDAMILLYGEPGDQGIRVTEDAPGFVMTALDTHFDTMASDVAFFLKSQKIKVEVDTLLHAVEGALWREFQHKEG